MPTWNGMEWLACLPRSSGGGGFDSHLIPTLSMHVLPG